MRDWLGPGTHVGYCTNVHGAETWAALRDALQQHCRPIAAHFDDEPVGVGLWLPAALLAAPDAHAECDAFTGWLPGSDATAFTINGFPYGSFQRGVVKHDVYRPDWTEADRLAYTRRLAGFASRLQLPTVTISTLPIGWRGNLAPTDALPAAARQLHAFVDFARRMEAEHGTPRIILCLEPEPGCCLETSVDVVRFFEEHLLAPHSETAIRRHIQVCHDVCHAAVMFEPQEQAFRNYASAGIGVAKVQISSALRVPFERMSDEHARRAALRHYARFVETRFLHQTTVRIAPNEARRGDVGTPPDAPPVAFHEDLPRALAERAGVRFRSAGDGALHPDFKDMDPDALDGEWRTHFHVPIYLESIGPLETTQGDIPEALRAARRCSDCRHFEVETYAWPVLPPELRSDDLADGIARELLWLRDLIEREGLGGPYDPAGG